MPLTLAQVHPGTVAYLSTDQVRDHPKVKPSKVFISEQDHRVCFVCYLVEGKASCWSPLTTRESVIFERLELLPAWRDRGYWHGRWGGDHVYLRDGGLTYRGPSWAFVEAAAGEWIMDPRERPFVSVDGVEAVIEEVRARGGFTSTKPEESGAP